MLIFAVFIVMLVWTGVGYWIACHEAPDGTHILDSNYIYIVTLWPVYLLFAGFYWLVCSICWGIQDIKKKGRLRR